MTLFDARAIDPWQTPAPVSPIPRPDYADSEQLKTSFGVCLGKGLDPFNAGLELFAGATAKALWVSIHWLNDPVVLASRDAYLKTLRKVEKPLDKDEFLAEVLSRAKAAADDKDAVAFFKLYSDAAGFTGKQIIDASTNNFTNNTNNFMAIKLVGGSDKSEIIDAAPNTKSKMQNEETSLPKLKLVGGSR